MKMMMVKMMIVMIMMMMKKAKVLVLMIAVMMVRRVTTAPTVVVTLALTTKVASLAPPARPGAFPEEGSHGLWALSCQRNTDCRAPLSVAAAVASASASAPASVSAPAPAGEAVMMLGPRLEVLVPARRVPRYIPTHMTATSRRRHHPTVVAVLVLVVVVVEALVSVTEVTRLTTTDHSTALRIRL